VLIDKGVKKFAVRGFWQFGAVGFCAKKAHWRGQEMECVPGAGTPARRTGHVRE